MDVHDFLELVLGALGRCISLLVHRLQVHIVVIIQIIWTAAAVLYGGRKADVCRRLLEGKVIETVIMDGALDSIGGGDVYLSNLSTDGSCLGCRQGGLQMVLLRQK